MIKFKRDKYYYFINSLHAISQRLNRHRLTHKKSHRNQYHVYSNVSGFLYLRWVKSFDLKYTKPMGTKIYINLLFLKRSNHFITFHPLKLLVIEVPNQWFHCCPSPQPPHLSSFPCRTTIDRLRYAIPSTYVSLICVSFL